MNLKNEITNINKALDTTYRMTNETTKRYCIEDCIANYKKDSVLLNISEQNKGKIMSSLSTESDLLYIKIIFEDELYKQQNKADSQEQIKILKLIKARENDFNFELRIAEIITGDNPKFPYKSGNDITEFFRECGFPYTHDGSTRRRWVEKQLKQINTRGLYSIIKSVFLKKYWFNLQLNIEEAKEELKRIIDSSCDINDFIDISECFGLNISNEILFNKEVTTADKDLNNLIETAKEFFIKGDKQTALEKIWGAFERAKTINDIKKINIINEMAKSGLDLTETELGNDFKNLTDIGNNYMIRHKETTQKGVIKNNAEQDYLFFRVLSTINLILSKIDLEI